MIQFLRLEVPWAHEVGKLVGQLRNGGDFTELINQYGMRLMMVGDEVKMG
jgi:hypothetical protein